jgi:hypothetical protein
MEPCRLPLIAAEAGVTVRRLRHSQPKGRETDGLTYSHRDRRRLHPILRGSIKPNKRTNKAPSVPTARDEYAE